MKKILIACAALLLVASCSKDSSPTAPASATSAKLIAMTVDVASGAGIPNVNVTLTRKDNGMTMTATTDASGKAVFTAPAGDYVLRIDLPAGYGLRSPVDGEIQLESEKVATITISLAKQ